MTWALYHLVRTGTCASGGPYVSARPCPSDTGAKIVGPVTIGAGARIGANAVVVDDVPEGATVIGVPAREVGEHSRAG